MFFKFLSQSTCYGMVVAVWTCIVSAFTAACCGELQCNNFMERMGIDMKEVKDKIAVHIDVTNACRFSCTNCYKFVGHYVRPYIMELETVKKAIDSLEGYQGNYVITGGEPTLHPDFAEICRYLRKKVPPEQRYLQTTGYKWRDYKSLIKKTFAGRVGHNDHKDVTEKHHPMLVAIKDVVADDSLRGELIDKCWVRERWSAVINAKGCFSCELAGAFDVLYNGPGGLPIEKGWWAKGHEHFNEQMERYCSLCGAALPQPAVDMKNNQDHISISNFRVLEKLRTPKFQKNRVLLVEKKYSPQDVKKIAEAWEPWQHLREEGSEKNIVAMICIFLKARLNLRYIWLSLRYIYRKFRKVKTHGWRFFWRLSRIGG